MNKMEFVRQLKATATAMKPLTESTPAGAATWDGKQYVRGVEKNPDPYALSWWSMLNAIADLLEAQDSPVNDAQLDYLQRTLFGGMGSLNDLYFDPKALGTLANSVNSSLDQRRRELHESFKNGWSQK